MPRANPRILRAFGPNAGVTAEARRRLADFLSRIHRDVVATIRRVHGENADVTDGMVEAAMRDVQNRHRKEWAALLALLPAWMARELRRSAKSAIKQELARKGLTEVKLTPPPDAKEKDGVQAQKGAPFIQRIIAAYWAFIGSAWLLGAKEGKPLPQILEDVDREWQREKQLTRNELGNMARAANSEVVDEIMKAAGVGLAVWEHHPGKKGGVRPTHVAMNGQTCVASVGLFDPAYGGYVLPGQLKYCMCRYRYILPDQFIGKGVNLERMRKWVSK